jgi:hypothetical protein
MRLRGDAQSPRHGDRREYESRDDPDQTHSRPGGCVNGISRSFQFVMREVHPPKTQRPQGH